jgi:hypothetical protein
MENNLWNYNYEQLLELDLSIEQFKNARDNNANFEIMEYMAKHNLDY